VESGKGYLLSQFDSLLYLVVGPSSQCPRRPARGRWCAGISIELMRGHPHPKIGVGTEIAMCAQICSEIWTYASALLIAQGPPHALLGLSRDSKRPQPFGLIGLRRVPSGPFICSPNTGSHRSASTNTGPPMGAAQSRAPDTRWEWRTRCCTGVSSKIQ
jgi:hypothetical protein